MVEWLFLAAPWGCLRFVIVVFSDHTHFLLTVAGIRYMGKFALLNNCTADIQMYFQNVLTILQ